MSAPRKASQGSESNGDLRRYSGKWRQRVAHGLAPLVLIAGVLVQRYHVHVHQQSAWSGGGFGMFSTVDVPDARGVRAYLILEGERALIVEPRIAGGLRPLYTRPTSSHLRVAAEQLLAQEWTVYDAPAFPDIWRTLPDMMQRHIQRSPEWVAYLQKVRGGEEPFTSDGIPDLYPRRVALQSRLAPAGGVNVSAEAVEIEVWKPRFDISTASLRWHLLASESATLAASP